LTARQQIAMPKTSGKEVRLRI